jgi:hypothetical protein
MKSKTVGIDRPDSAAEEVCRTGKERCMPMTTASQVIDGVADVLRPPDERRGMA